MREVGTCGMRVVGTGILATSKRDGVGSKPGVCLGSDVYPASLPIHSEIIFLSFSPRGACINQRCR